MKNLLFVFVIIGLLVGYGNCIGSTIDKQPTQVLNEEKDKTDEQDLSSTSKDSKDTPEGYSEPETKPINIQDDVNKKDAEVVIKDEQNTEIMQSTTTENK